MSFFLDIIVVLLCVWSSVGQKKVEESNTGALLKFPSVVDGPLYGKEWEVAPAQFGYQSYGGSIEAYLVLPMNTTYHLECPQNGKQEPLNKNAFIGWLQRAIDPHEDYGFIMVIDRGDCYFVEKVEFAQKLGAKACLIIDHTPENLFTMWMPDSWNDDIDIPSVLLSEKHGEILYEHLGVKNWQPKNIGGTTYPMPPAMNWTLATIEWGLPHDDDRVEWELWTSSNDPLAVNFKQNFKPVSLLLDGANDTVFEPRMYILNGSHYGCTTPPYLCGNQCTNQGRYCSVDPEFDLEKGISGAQVVQENLRNLCVWNYTKYHDELQHNLNESTWWDYAVMWDSNCAFPVNASEFKFTEACSHEQMDMIDGTQGLKEYVKKCVNDSGGYGENDTVNWILKKEVNFREKNSIYAMPMVRVNEFLIHGNIDCANPNIDDCQVLAAICAGFINNTAPEICDTSSPTPKPSSTPTLEGCEYDACGVCRHVSDPDWDACRGCDGKINSGFEENPCGICMLRVSSEFETKGRDCTGACDGYAEIDYCGKCLLPSNPSFNECITDSGTKLDLNLIIVIGIAVFIVVLLVILGFVCMRKKQRNLEDQLSKIAGSYAQMDDDGESKNTSNPSLSTNIKLDQRTDEEADQIL